MGACLSCLSVLFGGSNDTTSSTRETELRETQSSIHKKTFAISKSMSAPTVRVKEGCKVSGTGLAIVAVAIEQDAAYWEAHIEVDGQENGSDTEKRPYPVLFGVSTKKSKDFYSGSSTTTSLSSDKEGPPGTEFMNTVQVYNEDTIGIAVQQSDLPMIQFFRNGEPLHELAINRFRGTVYPSLYLPSLKETQGSEEGTNNEQGVTVRLIFNESDFQEMAPGIRFGPLIVARGII